MNETIVRALVRKLIKESILREHGDEFEPAEIETVEVGDLVDVMGGESDFAKVRVIELVDDVRSATGMPPDEDDMHSGGAFSGSGFVGSTDEGELVFSMKQIVPGSKAKYYFPSME